MTKAKTTFSIVLVLSLLFVGVACADGGMWVSPPQPDNTWILQSETHQTCAINYEGGFENMLLMVGVDELNENSAKAVWIFPVPAKPEDTVIDVLKGFPRMSGDRLEKVAENKMSDVFEVMVQSQVYTAPYFLFRSTSKGHYVGMGDFAMASGESNDYEKQGLIIHEHIEKMGLTTELITSERGDVLNNYLSDKGLKLDSASRAIFDEYIGGEYSFVVSWISDEKPVIDFNNCFAITPPEVTYGPTSDWDRMVRRIFGSEYQVADWYDFENYYNSGNSLTSMMDGLGLNHGESASVYRNGDKTYSSSRWYYISRHDHNKPGYYLAHNNLDNYLLSLGSWGGDRRIVAIKKSCSNGLKKYAKKQYPNRQQDNGVGVFVKFPAEKIYFPLKMTSLYGSQEIPISVYVMDYVTPEFYPKIEQGSKVEYYVGGSYSVSDDLLSFFNKKERIDNIKYTKIDIVAPSKYFADDLWISPSAPPKVILMDFVLNHSWIWGILLFAVISCLASLLAGSIVFRNDQPNKKHFALFGLFNFLTLIGFAIAAFVLKIDERFTKLKNEVKQKETSYKDAAKYVGAVLVGQLIVVGLVVLKIFDSLRGGLSDIVVVFFALPAIIVFVGLAIFFAFADKNAEFLVKNSKRLIKAATVYYVVEIVLFFFVIVLALSWAYNSPFFDLGEYVFFALFFIFSFLLATAIYKLIASGGNTMKLVSFVVLFSILFLVLLLGFWLVLGVLI